jgi:hypothetical protein
MIRKIYDVEVEMGDYTFDQLLDAMRNKKVLLFNDKYMVEPSKHMGHIPGFIDVSYKNIRQPAPLGANGIGLRRILLDVAMWNKFNKEEFSLQIL